MAKKKNSPEPACPNCHVSYVEHPGLSGTCAALQCELTTLKQIETSKSLRVARLLAISTIHFLETQRPALAEFQAHVVGGHPEATAVLESVFKKLGCHFVDVTAEKIPLVRKSYVAPKRHAKK